MICPKCGAEYVDGVTECSDCNLPLVGKAAQTDAMPDPRLDLQVVLATGHSDVIAVAKSILMSAGIEFCVVGEEVQDLFGYGRFPAGNNLFMGPVQILVRREDAADAAALLAGLESAAPEQRQSQDDHAPGSSLTRTWTGARAVAKIAAAVILVLFALEALWALVSSALGR